MANASSIYIDFKSLKSSFLKKNVTLRKKGWGLQLGWLIYSEEGRMLVARNEEISEWSWVKKIFLYNEATSPAGEVYLFLYEYPQNTVPLTVEINNRRFFIYPDTELQGLYSWRKVAFPEGVIHFGENSIILKTDSPMFSSWILGIEPINGKHSFKSWDKGENWQGERLGFDYSIKGEYLIRVYLKRYTSSGEITSPLFYLSDEWVGKRVYCKVNSDIPQETKVNFYIRNSDYKSIFSDKWNKLDNKEIILAHPWLQIKAILESCKGEYTPEIRGITIWQREESSSSEVSHYQLLPIVPFIFEDLSHPRLSQLRNKLQLDKVVSDAKNEFDVFLRLRSYIARQWIHQSKRGVYGPWDGLCLLEWTKKKQGHDHSPVIAMCVHFSILFAQACLSLGYHARLIVLDQTPENKLGGHFVVEVWSNELKKWILMDPDTDVHFEREKIPLNTLEIHRLWDEDRIRQIKIVKGESFGLNPAAREGFVEHHLFNGGYKRWGLLPRNDFFSHPDVFPVEHGSTPYHQTHFLWWRCPHVEENLYFPNSSGQVEDFYFSINQVYPIVKKDEKKVLLYSNTPGKHKFQLSWDKEKWEDVSPVISFKTLEKGPLFLRAMNFLGIPGPIERLDINML